MRNSRDIGGFGCSAFSGDARRLDGLEKYISYPEGKEVSGTKSILEEMFSYDVKISSTLWNKCYKTKNLKKIEENIPDVHCVMAEDVLMAFLIASKSEKFKVIEKSKCYSYRVGSGISTSAINESNVERFVKEVDVVGYLNDYLLSTEQFEKYGHLIHSIRKRLYTHCVWHLAHVKDKKLRRVAFRSLFCKADRVSLLPMMVSFAKNDADREILADSLDNLFVGGRKEERTGNIGLVFRDAFSAKEIKRTAQKLREQRVTPYLFFDEKKKSGLPEELKNENVAYVADGEIAKRERAISEAVTSYGLSVVVFFSEMDETLLYDILSARSVSAKAIVYSNISKQKAGACLKGKTLFEEKNMVSYVCRLADSVNIRVGSKGQGMSGLFNEFLLKELFQSRKKVKLYKRVAHGFRDGLRRVRAWART